MPDRPIRVALAGDDEAHRLLMERLADVATPDLDDLDARRRFVGDGQDAAFLNTSRRPARGTAPSGRPTYRSQRDGPRPLGHAAVFVESVKALAPRSDVVLVLVDEDGKAERQAAVQEARTILKRGGLQYAVLGVCSPIAEAWLVALIAPSRPQRARKLREALTFDPAVNPHKLNSKTGSPRHAKRVLHFLLDDARRGLADCPEHTPKGSATEPALSGSTIRHPGLVRLRDCGLYGFFEQLQHVYAPTVLG